MSPARRWQPGLRARLLAAMLGVLGALLIVNATTVVMRSEHALIDMQQERYVAVTRQLADTLRFGVMAGSQALMAPGLDVFTKTPDLVQVEVLDDKKRLLAVRGGPMHSQVDPRDAEQVVRIEIPVETLGASASDLDDELSTFGIAAKPAKVVGAVRALFSTQSTAQTQARLRRELIAAFALMGTLGLLAVFFLSSSVVRRTRILAQAASQVSRGELDVQVDSQRQALDDAADKLAEQESLSAIGRATAVIAHELKNPLGILLGAAQIVSNPKRPSQTREKASAIIVEEVRRLETSLNALLHYARPHQATRQGLALLDFSQNVIARASEPGGPAEQLRVAVLGEAADALVDEQHASQIVLNLLINAAQAGAKTVEITVQPTDDTVRLEIRDDGPGVSEDIRSQLFRPFVTSKQRGAGLGLAGSRRLARANQGDLHYEDAGPGACFVLTLETYQADESQQDKERQS